MSATHGSKVAPPTSVIGDRPVWTVGAVARIGAESETAGPLSRNPAVVVSSGASPQCVAYGSAIAV
jgi:hypothetical protein